MLFFKIVLLLLYAYNLGMFSSTPIAVGALPFWKSSNGSSLVNDVPIDSKGTP